jgi:hypothetical protein
VLLSQAATRMISALPSLPPSTERPYEGTTVTANARAALQRALDGYAPGQVHLPAHDAANADAASIASFGDTHGPELAQIDTANVGAAGTSGLPVTPPGQDGQGAYQPPTGPPPRHPATVGSLPMPVPQPAGMPASVGGGGMMSPPAISAAQLNQAPAEIPTSPAQGTHAALPSSQGAHPGLSPSLSDSSLAIEGGEGATGFAPTVAETGVPVAAGSGGPGPASGSLADLRRERFPSDPAGAPGGGFASAEDEKRALERADRERVLGAQPYGSAPPPPGYGGAGAAQHESADDEKKRLEREERERILAAGGTGPSGGQQPPPGGPGAEDLPPYEEPV